MTLDPGAFISGAAGVVSSLGVCGLVGGIVIRSKFVKVDKLEGTVAALKDTQVAAIDRRLTVVENETRVLGRIDERLQSIQGQIGKMEPKLDGIGERLAAAQSDRAADRRFLDNLNESHRQHVADREAHRHG